MSKSFILPSFAPTNLPGSLTTVDNLRMICFAFPCLSLTRTNNNDTGYLCSGKSAICLPHRVAHLNPRSVYLDRSRKLKVGGGVVKRKMLFVGRKDDVVHFNPNLFIVCQLLVLNGPLMPILTMRRQVGRLVIRQKIAGGATKGREGKGRFSSH